MTFSILARDCSTGALGGAAATGSLCVGGWVLRGALGAGLSASQGAAPSTFWGEGVLEEMRSGQPAQSAIDRITQADRGRAQRQLSALSAKGDTGAFTGAENTPVMGSRAFDGGIASGNMLHSEDVLGAMVEGYAVAVGPLAERLLSALRAAETAGGDSRGLLSAALLVLHPEAPPLTLRIDHAAKDPIGALEALYAQATTGEYAAWARQVPTAADRERILD